MEKSDEFPELSYSNWLCDLAFDEDIFSHMNELNMKLQGKDQFVNEMYTNIIASKSELTLFPRQISNKSFAHFPTPASRKSPLDTRRNTANHWTTCTENSAVGSLFLKGKKDKTIQLVSCPLSQDPETAPQELQLELINLQSDSVLKEMFNSIKLDDFMLH